MIEPKKRAFIQRMKLSLMVVALVAFVVLVMCISLGAQLISTSERALGSELFRRTTILVSTIASQAAGEIQKGPAAGFIGRLRSAGEYPSHRPRPDCRIACGSLPLLTRPDLASFPARSVPRC